MPVIVFVYLYIHMYYMVFVLYVCCLLFKVYMYYIKQYIYIYIHYVCIYLFIGVFDLVASPRPRAYRTNLALKHIWLRWRSRPCL